jgi:hypothetical protein
VFAFAAQMASFLASPTATIAIGARGAVLIAMPATIVVFMVLERVSKSFGRRYERQIRQAIATAEAEAAAAERRRRSAGKS